MKTLGDPLTTDQDLQKAGDQPRKDLKICLVRKKKEFKNFDS